MALSCVMYIRYDNKCYLKSEFQQQEAISWYTTLVTRVKSAEGYRDELPVAWVGRMEMEDKTLYSIEELNQIYLASYELDEQQYINNWAWEAYLARWCGFRPETVEPETVEQLPEVQAMPHYPDDGSIQVIQDVVVVRF